MYVLGPDMQLTKSDGTPGKNLESCEAQRG